MAAVSVAERAKQGAAFCHAPHNKSDDQPPAASHSDELTNWRGLEAFRYWEALLGRVLIVAGACWLSEKVQSSR